MADQLTNLFPFWLLLIGAIALRWPQIFIGLNQGNLPVLILTLIMLGMGLTLSLDDFRRVGRLPRAVLTGFCAQYLIMPFLGWAIAAALRLPPALAVGLILVGTCPGGTASNLITYIARADVALSVVMTLASTLAAVVMTPVLTQFLAGAYVPVNGWLLFAQTLQVVILPVAIGVALNRWAPRLVRQVLPIAPLLSVVGICLICAATFSANAEAILQQGRQMLLGVFLLHSLGFALGWGFAKLCGYSQAIARTIAIEVGMQNSGLAIILARQAFPLLPLAAAVGAISGVMHSLIGSFLAVIWRSQAKRQLEQEQPYNSLTM
ncbi:bile acid:sodium symporter family protein [Synechococcus elongatus]|uniref:bile acid:sodium symporter family protein n=1 Tax=Synechococcus elongatus TaxID=32046 RepID=UPI0030CB0D6F